jgi:hypothetical protein
VGQARLGRPGMTTVATLSEACVCSASVDVDLYSACRLAAHVRGFAASHGHSIYSSAWCPAPYVLCPVSYLLPRAPGLLPPTRIRLVLYVPVTLES